jgi:hypothetical protein
VRYAWIAIIVVTAAPLLYVGWLANPLSFILFGPEAWRDRIVPLYPYRWWILFLILVCGLSVAVYTAGYE